MRRCLRSSPPYRPLTVLVIYKAILVIVQCSESSCVPPPPYRLTTTNLQTLPPPDHSPLFALIRWPGQAVWPAPDIKWLQGPNGCLLGGFTSPVAMSCVYGVVLLCCWGVFPVLTLYSPRSIVWGLFFFSSLSSCKCCIFLQFYLHFTTDYTCMIVYVTNNKEPNSENWSLI